jgi:DNA-binding NtrC family response regulator
MGRARVLIVDDDKRLLRLLVRLLVREGYEVRGRDDFKQAMEQLVDGWPDILLTDVRLGSYNGLQLAIIARERNPGMATVVMTGHDDPVLHEEATRSGARYVTKPLRPTELLDTVALALAESRRSPVRATEPPPGS